MSTVPPLQSLLDNPRYGELSPDLKVEAIRAWEKDEIERRNTSGDWDLESRAIFEVETRRARQAALGIEPQSPEEILRGVIEDEKDPEAEQVWDALDEVQAAEREQREINRRRIFPWKREDDDAAKLEAIEGRIVAAKSGVAENEIEQARLGAEALQGKRDAAVVRGKLILNPELYYDRERYVAAVNASSATPREKARALAGFYRGREETAKAALPKLRGIGAFRAFADTYATENPEATNGDVVEAFRKSGAGEFDKWYESISSGFLSAMEGVGYLGFAAGAIQKKLGDAIAATGLEPVGNFYRNAGTVAQDLMLKGLAETGEAREFSADRVQTLGGASTAQQYGQVGGQLFGQVALTMLTGPMSGIGRTAAGAATKKALATEIGKKLGVGGMVKKWSKETVQMMFSPAGVMAGASSAGPALYESYERNRAKLAAEGLTGSELEETARGEAFVDATRSALITSTITSLFGLRGVEGVGRLTQVAANPAAREVIKKTAKERWVDAGLGALSEGAEEALDEGINGGLDALLENPDMTFEDWEKATLFAGSAGALFGGGIEGVTQIAEAVAERVKNSPEIRARQEQVQQLRASGLNQTADALERANVVAESDAIAAAIDEVESRAVGAVERLDAIDAELVELAKTPGTETKRAELEAERDSLNEALMIGRDAMRNYDPVKTANIAVADVVAEGVEPEEARRRVAEVMNTNYRDKPVTPQILAAQALAAEPAATPTPTTDEEGILQQTEADAQTEDQSSEVLTSPAPVSPVTPVKAEPTFRAIAGRPALVDNEAGDIRIDEDGTVLLDRGPSAPPIIVSRNPDSVISTSEFNVTLDEETEADLEQARVLRTTIGGRPTPRPIERPAPSSTFVRDDGSIVTSFSGERGPVAAVTDFVGEGETEAGDLFVTVKDRETGSEFELHGDDALTVAIARRDTARDPELTDAVTAALPETALDFDRVLVRMIGPKANLLAVVDRLGTDRIVSQQRLDAALDELITLNTEIENENFPEEIRTRLLAVVDDAFNDLATVRARVRQRPEAPADRGTPAPATPPAGGAETPVDQTPAESAPSNQITESSLDTLSESDETGAMPQVDSAPLTAFQQTQIRFGGTQTPSGSVLPPKFDAIGQIPGSIDSKVARLGIEDIELGEGRFFDGKWASFPFVSVKPTGQPVRTVRFRSPEEANRFYDYLRALTDEPEATPETPAPVVDAVEEQTPLADDVVETAMAATEGNPEARAELMAAMTPEQLARFEPVMPDNIEGRAVTVRPDGKIQVQSEENRLRAERGERPISGDRIFATREEAETETRREIEIDRRNAEFRARQDAETAAREAAEQAKAAPLKEYLDDAGFKGVSRGRVEATLSAPKNLRNSETGKVYNDTRFNVIQAVINDGGRVEAKSGKRTEFRLYSDQDSFWVINKTEYDAGLWVMAKNEPTDDFPVDDIPLDASPTGPSRPAPTLSESDAEYLAAVESGDMETVQEVAFDEILWEKEIPGDDSVLPELRALAERFGIQRPFDTANILERWVESGIEKNQGATAADVRIARDLVDRGRGRIERPDEVDGFFYHVTTKKRAKEIFKSGEIKPGQPAQFSTAATQANSVGRVFVSDLGGVSFWRDRIQEQLDDRGSREKLTVLRIPKSFVKNPQVDDAMEKRSDSFYTESAIPVSAESGATFSLLPASELDTAYLAAVESGDMETAQRMVDEAARAAGYDIGPVWHGSSAYSGSTKHKKGLPFSVFKNRELGFHFGSENQARERAGISKGFANLQRAFLAGPLGVAVDTYNFSKTRHRQVLFAATYDPSFVGRERTGEFIPKYPIEKQRELHGKLADLVPGFPRNVFDETEGAIPERNALNDRKIEALDSYISSDQEAANIISETLGFKTLVYPNRVEGDGGELSYVALQPQFIKSADPVTYDESGNVIPLSQRFNPASDSILEAAPTSTSYTEESSWAEVTSALLDRAIAKYPKIPVTKDASIPAPARTMGLRILVNPTELARYTEGMEVADAAEMIEKIFIHEATHRHAVAEVGDNVVVDYANTMTADERTDVASQYLHRSAYPNDEAYLKAVTDFAAVDPNLPAGERRVRLYRLGHEALRMNVERLVSGYTTEETLAFLQTNPGNLQRFLRYLGSYLRRLKEWFRVRKDPAIGVEVKRLTKVLKTLTEGETISRGPVSFDPDAKGSGRQLVGLNAGPVKQTLWRLTDGRTEWITDGDPVPVGSSKVRSQTVEENPMDAEYLAAVESGDMETAQRMVDEAARAAGYATEVFHGTAAKEVFNIFRDYLPNFFTTSQEYASGYTGKGGGKGRVLRLFLKSTKPLDTRTEEGRRVFNEEFLPWVREKGWQKDRFGAGAELSDSELVDFTKADLMFPFLKSLLRAGDNRFDSYLVDERFGNYPASIVPILSSQIKSADPVTYDESGKIIPLSQRFNPESDSILEAAPVGVFNRPKANTYVPGGGLTAAYRWDRRVYKMLEAARGEYSGYMKKAEFAVKQIARLMKDMNVSETAVNAALGNTENRLTQADVDQIKAIKKRGLAAAQGVYLSARNKAKALDAAGMFADAALARQEAKQQFDLDVQTYQRAAANYEARARKAAAAKAYADRRAAMAALPKPLADEVANLRTEIDLLSDRMIAEGDLSAELKATISANKELWLHRSYQIFDDPNYAAWIKEQKDPEAVRLRNKTITFLRNDLVTRKIGELMAGGMDRTSATAQAKIEVTDAHVADAFDDYLMVADNGSKTLLTGATVSKEVSALMKRGVIPQEIQELWGRYDDPAVNAAKSIGAIAQHLAIHKFYQDTVALGTKEGWLVKDAPGVLKRDAQGNRLVELLPNNGMAGRYGNTPKSQYAPLAGYLGPEALRDALAQMVDDRAGHRFIQFFTQLTGYSMASKTVLSWQSGMRNFWGNVLPSMINGNVTYNLFDPRYNRARIGAFAQLFGRGTAQTRAYVERATALGVLGDSITDNLIRDLTGGFDSNKKVVGILGKVTRAKFFGPLIDKTRKAALKTYDFSGKAYNMPDEFWKIVNFEGEKARLREMLPNETEEQIEVRAAEIVRNTMPTYSRAPEWVKVLRKFPVMAPFITFPAEMVRITLGQGKVGLDFIREGKATGNKKMETAGYLRLLTSGLVAGVVGSIPMIAKTMLDISTDDEDDLRKHLAPWEKNVTILFLGRNEDDPAKINYLNLSFMNPYDIWLRPWRSFVRGMRDDNASGIDAIAEAIGELMDPVAKEQILFGSLVDTLRGVTATGRKVWDKTDSDFDKAVKSMTHVYNSALEPGTIASVERIAKAARSEVSVSGRAFNVWQETVSAGLGLKANTVDITSTLAYAAKDFRGGRLDSISVFSRAFKSSGTQSDEDIINAYVETNDKMLRTYRELYEKTVGAVRLGAMTRQEAVQLLRSEGVPTDVIGDIMNNRYRRYTPSPDSLQDARRKGEKLGQDRINLYRQALDRVPPVQQISEDTFF